MFIGTNMSDVDLIINVHTNGIKDITNLSAATKALALNLRGITVPMSKLDVQSRALNKALGMTTKGMNDHAKSIKELVTNQKALSTEAKRVQSNIGSYRTAIQAAGGANTEFGRELIQNQRQLIGFNTTIRGLKIRAFGSDLQNVSLKMQRIGKDAQFVGRSLMMNLTAPIMLFARLGYQNLVKVDEQFVRLTKVLEGVAMTTEQANIKLADYLGPDKQARVKQMTDSFNQMNTALTNLSTKFGVSKDLVIGLAVDFAELGITANENINALTELSLVTEKLGNMDASGAQDLSQALYFNATRAYEAAGAFANVSSAAEREAKSIKSATVQLQMFNTIENVTALSLKDLADSLPEVGGMAISFGLSMTEAAALLAPMKAAGFDVGASANSIKVSLQRAIVPTKQNVELLARLSKQYGATGKSGNAFNESTKTGLTGLQAIVDIFGKVVDGGRNTEGALKLMSEIFEKRQGPRMYVAIEQLTQFDQALKNVNANQSPERLMAGVAENSIRAFNKFNNTTLPETITQFSDIGVIARIAASEVGAMVDGFTGKGLGGSITEKEKQGAIEARAAVAALIKEKKLNEDIDLISQVKTQAGRAMLVELAGASNAQQVADMELKQSLASLTTATQRIRNAFKNFASDIIRIAGPSIKALSDKINSFYLKWNAMSDATKARIAKVILAFMGLLAALGPVVLALGTMQASVGVIGRGISFFIPKLKNFEGGLVGIAKGAKLAATNLDKVFNSFVGKKLDKTLLPSIASGAGSPAQMIGIPQRSGRNIKFPGNVLPDLPHDLADRTKLPTARDVYNSSGYRMNASGRLVDSSGRFVSSADAASLRTKMSGATSARRAASKANKAIMDPFNAAQKFAGEQYARNESNMRYPTRGRFAKLDALKNKLTFGSADDPRNYRVDAAGKFRTATGRFAPAGTAAQFAQASALREGKLLEAGISRTATGATRLATKSGLVDISEQRALKIARGGIGGQIARRTVGLDGLGARFTAATGVTGKGFLRGMLPGNGKLVSDQGAANVRGIASAAWRSGPVAAYTKSVNGAKAAVKAMQYEQMAMGGKAGVIKSMTTAMGGFMKSTKLGTIALKLMKLALVSSGIGAIMLGIGVAVYIIVKNFGTFKEKASGAILRVKNAFAIFKEAIMMVIQPFVNLFAMLDGGSKKGGDAVGGLAKAFDGVAKVLQKVAQWFKMLVENYVQPYLYMIIDIVMFVISIFQGNWGKAFDYLVAAVAGAAKLVIKLFAALLKAAVWITAGGIKLVIGYFTLIPKAVAKAFSWLENLPFVGGIFGGISDGINAVVDSLYGLVDAGKNAANGVIDAVAGAAIGLLDKGVSKGISGSAAKVNNDKQIPNAADKKGEEAGEIMGNSFSDAVDDSDIGGKIAKSITDGIAEAVQQLQDYVAGEFKNAMDKFADAAVKSFEKQKASALKVFDTQIKTLNKLEKAEESLTKKKEYEVNRRKLIDDKTLSDETYRRNYALAVYEGRIDDARALQQQQKADQRAFGDDLVAIDDARAKDLAKENLDALKDAINEAKDAAGIFFDEAITKFQESAALITKIAPVTIEQYTEQLANLQKLTEDNSLSMNTTFGGMFEKFATTISDKMPNRVIGAFATNLDDLVQVAKDKYGLAADTSENTIIGATIGMLADVGTVFGNGKQSVIDSFGLITSGLKDNFSEMKTKFLDEVRNDFVTNFKKALDEADPTKVFNQAIIDGNLSILRSFQNLVELNPGLMEKLKNSLDPAILKYIELKAAADAAKDAAAGAAGAPPSGGGGGTPGTTPSTSKIPGTPAGARVDAWEKNNALRAIRGLRALTYAEFTGNKTPTFKKGGIIPSRAQNQNSGFPEGYIPAPTQEGVPALLHGGEYILNAKAVSRIGVGALNKMNNNLIPRFAKGGVVPGKKGTPSNTRGRSADTYEAASKVATNVALKKLAIERASIPYNERPALKTQKNLSFVEKAIFKATDNKFVNTLFETKNFMETVGAAIGSTGGKTGMVAGSAIGRGIGSFFEQIIDDKKGVSTQKIAKETGFGAIHGLIGLGVDAALGKVVSKIAPKILSKFAREAVLNNLDTVAPAQIRGALPAAPKMLALGAGSPLDNSMLPALRTKIGAFDLNALDIAIGDMSAAYSSIPGFNIDGKIVTFGNIERVLAGKTNLYESGFSAIDGQVFNPLNTVIKNIPSDPYTLSGLAEFSASGAQTAANWHFARSLVSNSINDGGLEVLGSRITSVPQVDALLYAGSNGDIYAKSVFEKLAELGKAKISAAKAASFAKASIEMAPGIDREISGMPQVWQDLMSTGSVDDMLEKLIIVHERQPQNPFAIGKKGDLFLKPTGDYNPGTKFFSNMGTSLAYETKIAEMGGYFTNVEDLLRNPSVRDRMSAKDIEKFNLFRNTIHFGINSPVAGHMARQEAGGEILLANLKAVRDANPGALDTLFAVDSYFTPKDLRGLRIPKDAFQIFRPSELRTTSAPDYLIRRLQTGYYQDNQFSTVSDQLFRDMKNHMLVDKMKQLGGTGLWETGEHYTNSWQDAIIRKLALELRLNTGLHANHYVSSIESLANDLNYAIPHNYDQTIPIHYYDQFGENALPRLIGKRNNHIVNYLTQKYNPSHLSHFKTGGYVPGAPSMAIPAILHGGEYVVNADAVRNMGVRTMQNINQSRFRAPSGTPSYAGGGQTTNVSTLNINVDTFIGQEEWFKGMMKDYNINVLPKQQKAAGLESRTFTSYNGIQGF